MSDDEYYYDSPYEDLADLLWDADPDKDLADDLAEHAAYSPIWQDNPVEELKEYFSDWEYYSDDYYDDDPNAIKNGSLGDRGPHTSIQRKSAVAKRGRKRKLADTQMNDTSEDDRMKALTACLRGVVWVKDRPARCVNTYDKGQQPSVALKLDRTIMQAAYNQKRGFGQTKLSKDEAWANNMSLADMGLKTEKSVSLQTDQIVDGAQNGEEEPADVEEDVQEDSPDDAAHEDSYTNDNLPERLLKSADSVQNTASRSMEDATPAAKRQRTSNRKRNGSEIMATSPGVSSTVEVINTTSEKNEPQAAAMPVRRTRVRRREDTDVTEDTKSMAHQNTKGRKRRLSAEPVVTASTESSRAKRVATVEIVGEKVANGQNGGRPSKGRRK